MKLTYDPGFHMELTYDQDSTPRYKSKRYENISTQKFYSNTKTGRIRGLISNSKAATTELKLVDESS